MLKLDALKCVNNNIDLDIYLNFINYVKSTMEHPEWLGDFTKDDLETMLKEGTRIWMYYLDNEIVCSMMTIPSTQKSLDKFEIKLDYKIVVDYGQMAVNIKYVGNRLQYQMLKELEEYSKKEGYEYAASTIHPDNTYCINNFIKDNFELINYKEFKRGPRNIYLKKLK